MRLIESPSGSAEKSRRLKKQEAAIRVIRTSDD